MVRLLGSGLTSLRRTGVAEIDRQRETGRAAVAQARDLVALVLQDLDRRRSRAAAGSRGFRRARARGRRGGRGRSGPSSRTPRRAPRRSPMPRASSSSTSGDRHQRPVGDDELSALSGFSSERRWSTSPRPWKCGRWNASTSTPGEEAAQRLDSGVVRAVGVADEQRPLVEPDRVAALRELVAFEPAEDGQRQVGGERLRLAAPFRLARLEQDRAGGVTSTGS